MGKAILTEIKGKSGRKNISNNMILKHIESIFFSTLEGTNKSNILYTFFRLNPFTEASSMEENLPHTQPY